MTQEVFIKLIESRKAIWVLKEVQRVIEEWCEEATIEQFQIIGPFNDDGIYGMLIVAIVVKKELIDGS